MDLRMNQTSLVCLRSRCAKLQHFPFSATDSASQTNGKKTKQNKTASRQLPKAADAFHNNRFHLHEQTAKATRGYISYIHVCTKCVRVQALRLQRLHRDRFRCLGAPECCGRLCLCELHLSAGSVSSRLPSLSAQDVHKLFVMVKNGVWREFMSKSQTKAGAVHFQPRVSTFWRSKL